MTPDFLDAHQRHWDDAERLFAATRWANADHLYGMAVECGLKRLMIAFGMSIGSDGSPSNSQDRAHVMETRRIPVWDRYETYRSGHHQGANYGLPQANPFHDWDVSQRYADQSNFTQARVQPHRTAADTVYKLIIKATLEGLT